MDYSQVMELDDLFIQYPTRIGMHPSTAKIPGLKDCWAPKARRPNASLPLDHPSMFTGSSLRHPEMGREEKGAPVADAIDLSAIDGPPSHLQLRQPPPYDSSASLWPRTLLLRFLGVNFRFDPVLEERCE
ncbi:hypothetical protein GW17_00036247 [Ensete ventricosum]|nr:hypothetical protein GW17_00036247 [Ensete ventricosum]